MAGGRKRDYASGAPQARFDDIKDVKRPAARLETTMYELRVKSPAWGLVVDRGVERKWPTMMDAEEEEEEGQAEESGRNTQALS